MVAGHPKAKVCIFMGTDPMANIIQWCSSSSSVRCQLHSLGAVSSSPSKAPFSSPVLCSFFKTFFWGCSVLQYCYRSLPHQTPDHGTVCLTYMSALTECMFPGSKHHWIQGLFYGVFKKNYISQMVLQRKNGKHLTEECKQCYKLEKSKELEECSIYTEAYTRNNC